MVWIDNDWRRWLMVPESVWLPFLQSHPALKTVHWPGVDVDTEPDEEETQQPALTSPMTYVTQMAMRLGDDLKRPDLHLPPMFKQPDVFPNLCRVMFDIPCIFPKALQTMTGQLPVPTMLEVHGRKIVSLDCMYERTLWRGLPQLQYFGMIATYCPNLEELGLFFNWTSQTTRNREAYQPAQWEFSLPVEMPSVQKLRVRRMNRRFDEDAYREMIRFVLEAVVGEKRKLPNCDVIQFESERDVGYLLRHRTIFHRDLNFSDIGDFAILDHTGLPLQLGSP